MKYNYGVFIGRFQPFHNSHLDVAKYALTQSKELIIIIGSAKSALDIKNPFSYNDRVEMIKSCFTEDEIKRIHFAPSRDYFYAENMWIIDVQRVVNEISDNDESIALFGSFKDESSYYLKLFPQWEHLSFQTAKLNATDIRSSMFETHTQVTGWQDKAVLWSSGVPKSIVDQINNRFIGTELFSILQKEYTYIKKYKEEWANSPHKPVFVTVDAVTIKSGHILLIKRKSPHGFGRYALPGGYIDQDETTIAGAIRELKEETKIDVHKAELHKAVMGSKVFDYPGRSLRGRTITHAYHLDLGDGPLPKVKGNDDASGAFWVPLATAIQMEDQFFEDHWHIIFHFMQSRR